MEARLAEVLGGLSLACDQANAFPPGKAQRTAVIAVAVARRAGFDDDRVRDAFLLSLLRYLGCVGFAHEEAHTYGAGDDRAVRNVMSMADVADPVRTVGAIVRGVGAGARWRDRAVAVARLLGDTDAVQRHAQAQCEVSERLARTLGASDALASTLRYVCERWDGRGEPRRVAGLEIPEAMRAHHIADVVEIAFHRGGLDAARAVLRRRGGAQLDPQLCEALLGDFDAAFEGLDGALWPRFLDAEPAPHATLDAAGIDAVALALGRFVDLRSVFTVGHSEGVAALADAAAQRVGLPDDERRLLRRAAHLHDLGRLGVSSRIWDHPGPLDPMAWEQVRLHAYFTERVLHASPALRPIAALASGAHERLDGGGYHRAVPAAVTARAARVLAAADALHAMRETRPHRAAMRAAEAAKALRDEARAGRIDARCADAVLDAAGIASPTPARATTLTARELDVMRLVARGKTNKEIGSVLGISSRTVQVHLGHAYDKAGVHSRAGATLHMLEHGLLGDD
ncbi:MAG: LuxR C-terminal-related transcriptional regulator [Polyangiales bacterium]